MTEPDPLVLARIQKVAETTDGPSLVQSYMDLLTFGPAAFVTLLAVVHGEVVLPRASTHSADAREAVLGALAWLGHRYPDDLFTALGDPHTVAPPVACTIEPIDDPRTTEILLAAVEHADNNATRIILRALVRRRDDRVPPLLERTLFSTDRALRVRAAEGLYAMGTAKSADAMRPVLGHEDDHEVRAILTDALTRIDDPNDDRELHWLWVVVRPRFAEYGVAAFDEDDALAVLGVLRYPGRELPEVRSVTDLDAVGATAAAAVGWRHPIGLPAWRGLWSPHNATVWQRP